MFWRLCWLRSVLLVIRAETLPAHEGEVPTLAVLQPVPPREGFLLGFPLEGGSHPPRTQHWVQAGGLWRNWSPLCPHWEGRTVLGYQRSKHVNIRNSLPSSHPSASERKGSKRTLSCTTTAEPSPTQNNFCHLKKSPSLCGSPPH